MEPNTNILVSVIWFLSGCFFVSGQTSVLSGRVFDVNGSVIVGAKVTAVGGNGKRYEARTSEGGNYKLTLPYVPYEKQSTFRITNYELIVESTGFEKCSMKNLKFVPAYDGKMQVDVALDIAISLEPCGPGGACGTR